MYSPSKYGVEMIECSPSVCQAVDLGPLLAHECDHDGFADNGETLHLYVPLRNEEPFPVMSSFVQMFGTKARKSLI